MENIKKDVWLSIHSTQHFAGCEEEEINLVTQARLYRRNGKYYIAYDESELTGLEGTRTTLKLDGKTVRDAVFGKPAPCRAVSDPIRDVHHLHPYLTH